MKRIPKWEIFEFCIPIESNFENPFLEVELQAVFEMDPKTPYIIDGFYDGMENAEHIWRIRFAPMQEGKWTFQTRSNISALDKLSGEFECIPAVSRGPLKIHPDFPNWFSRGDHNAQLIINDGWFPHTVSKKSFDFEVVDFQPPSEEDFKNFIDILADHKVNLILGMSELYARQPVIADTTFLWPWKVIDPLANRIDKERFNLDFYRRWERTIQHAKERNLFYAYEMLYDNSLVRPTEWGNHPYNIKNGGWLNDDSVGEIGWHNLFDIGNEQSKLYLGRYIRYTIARLACYWNICWEIGAENANLAVLPQELLPNARFPVEKIAEWYRYWAQYIKQYDPYRRLRTFGDTTHHPLMVCENGNDFILTQDPRNYPHNDARACYFAMREEGVLHWKYQRPVVIGEMDCSNNGNYHHERRMYWIALTSGYMMSRSDRHFGFMNGNTMIESERFGLNDVPSIYLFLQIMHDYIEQNVSFWRMHPANELVKSSDLTCTLAEEEKEYLIYFPFGGKAELTLPDSESEWFNPRSGEVQPPKHHLAGAVSFEAEDTNDWVLHIIVK